MRPALKFTRTEAAGSLGDLGTLLPLSVGLVAINGLDPTGIFWVVGLVYIGTGLFYRVTSPVEPMKVISGYAIATSVSAGEIQASCLWVAVILFIFGISGLIDFITRYISTAVIRGIQLSTGILLLSQGVRLMIGSSPYQLLQGAGEPFLRLQEIGMIPIGVLLGSIFAVLGFFLLDNRRMPAAIVIVAGGMAVGFLFGAGSGLAGLRPGFNLPSIMPYGMPGAADFSLALIVLTLPQVPMTLANAVIANADLSAQYFGSDSRRVTRRNLCLSMALANLGSFVAAGIPLCHGAGGLASRYRFGARTGGSNLIIGVVFVGVAVLLGAQAVAVINLLPLSVLGVLLVFAGAQLGLTISDISAREDIFVILLIVGITLAANLAAGFIVGVFVDRLLHSGRFSV